MALVSTTDHADHGARAGGAMGGAWDMVSRRMMIGLGLGAGVLAVGGGVTALSYRQAMDRANARVAPALSQVIDTRFGALEYAEAGSGVPVLMIHGSGGGFDQGLLFARPLVAMGYRVIAPSRFGYLRSDFPEQPHSANQADAFAELLDHLGLERVVVSGGSAGALSALEFAVRHPDRTAALIPVVPATHVPGRTVLEQLPPAMEMTLPLLRSDFLFWAALTLAPDMLTGSLLATDPALLKTVSADEQARARETLWSILPVSRRADGLVNDMRLAGNPAPTDLAAITAPTLAISLDDDRYDTAAATRHIAATVPGGRSLIYPTGGHIWLGHDAELFGAIDTFLKEIGIS